MALSACEEIKSELQVDLQSENYENAAQLKKARATLACC
mgnify:CR=1 FL=1